MMRSLRGFTLIELLIVMIIISIASTIIVVKSGHYYLQNKSADTVARELSALMRLARSQAILSSSTLGFSIAENEYHFVKLTNTGWEELSKTDLFWREQTLPDNVVLTLQVQAADRSADKISASPVQIIFYSSGEVTPFQLVVQRKDGGSRYQITSSFTGTIHLE